MRKYLLASFLIIVTIPFAAQAAAPADPTGFTASAPAESNCAINLSWNTNTSVHYGLDYTTSSGFLDPTKINSLGTVTASPYKHTNLPLNSGWDYIYRIWAIDNITSLLSQKVISNSSVSTPILNTPDAPSGLTASSTSNGQQIVLSWQESTALSSFGGFKIYSSTDGTNFTNIVQSISFGNIYASLPNLDATKVYYYKLKSYESGDGCAPIAWESGFSNMVKIPTIPKSLSAVYNFPANQINLSWMKGSGQDYTEVWRKEPTDANFTKIATENDPSKVISSDTNIITNHTYLYEVRGCSVIGANVGCSDFAISNPVMVTNVPQNPTAQIYFINGTKGNVRVSWDNTFPWASSYLVERAGDDGVFSQVGLPVPVPVSSGERVIFPNTDVPLGQNYTYRVRSYFSGTDYSGYSAVVNANLNMALSLTGRAWAMASLASGVGWVNFNSDYENPLRSGDPHYSVQIDRDGLMSGAAWAAIDRNEDYGWLSFNKSDLVECDKLPGVTGPCEARVSTSTGVMSGWARFLRPANYSGTWDGWVSLSGMTNNASPKAYGISFNPVDRTFNGEVWGSDIVGWLVSTSTISTCGADAGGKSRCLISGVLLDRPPVVTNVKISRDADAWCAAVPAYKVSWDYSDVDGDMQQSVDVKIVAGGVTVTSTEVIQNSSSTYISYPIEVIGSSTEFSALVRAADEFAGYGDWSNLSDATTTPSSYYPFVDFDWTPTSTVATGTILKFTDITTYRGTSFANRLWNFVDATPHSTTTSPVSVIVGKIPLDVSLTVTDSASNSCIGDKTIEGSGTATGVKRRIFRER